jgi:hypothetical protein
MEIRKIYLKGRYNLDPLRNEIQKNQQLKWSIVDDPGICDYYICIDEINANFRIKHCIYVLIRYEPRIVLPECYKKKNTNNFEKIIDIGKLNDPKTIGICDSQNLQEIITNKARVTNKMVIINSNLFSLRSQEMYSLRRKAIFKIDYIDLYGYGWDKNFSSKFKTLVLEIKGLLSHPSPLRLRGQLNYFFKKNNSKGPVENKYTTYANYKYALIIENSNTYVSEKIFDALASGCIPIYVGINLEQFMVPNCLYIKSEPSIDSIKRAFKLAQEINYYEWHKKLQKWIQSEEVREAFSYKSFLLRLRDAIEKPTYEAKQI